MATSNATGFSVGASINPFEQAMRKLVDAAKNGQGGVANALGSLADGPLAGLKAAFAGISALLAGGFIKNAVNDTAKMTENAMDLGRALGVTTNEARAIQIAMEDIGASTGEYEGAAKGLTKRLKENEDEMNKMGLATRDAAGNLRPMNELVADGIKVLGTYKEGTDRMLASQFLFGKGLDASSKLMLYNQQVQEDARVTMEKFGLTVGANSVAAWKEFDAATDEAGFGVEGMKKAIGDSLIPVVTTLVNLFGTLMPAAIVVVRGALSGLTSAFLFVKNGVQVLWETLQLMLYSVLEPLRGLTEMIGRALTGDFSGAVNAFKGMGTNMANAWSGSLERMANESRKTAQQVYNLFARDDQPGSGGGPGVGTQDYVSPEDKKKEKDKKEKVEREAKEPSAMPTYELALNARKQAFERENTLREFSKQQELAYWQDILGTYEVGSKDRTAIAAKMGQLELDILRQGAKEKREIGQLHAEDWKAETLDYIAELEARATFEREQGTLTQADYLARKQAFNSMRLQAELDFVLQKIEVAKLDPESNVVALEQLELQKLEIRRKYAKLTADIGRESAAELSNPITNIAATINQSFSQLTNSLLTNWRTLGSALRGVLSSIGQSIIQEIVLKPLQAKMVAWAKERMLTIAGIGADAAKAGSGAAASQASIPIIGPLLAVGAMMMILSQVSAMKSNVPSAAGGFDVPRGLNPLTQLHEQEMVLPASIANPLRQMVGEGGNAGGGGGDVYQNHIYLPGGVLMESRDLVDFLKQNPEAVAAGVKQAARRGFM